MIEHPVLLIIISLASLLIIRGYMSLSFQLSMSKKERKNYKKSAGILNRWFFWSAPCFVKDQYSKFEKRTIRYTIIVPIYRAINIAHHVLCLATLLTILVNRLTFLPLKYTEAVYFTYILFCLVVFCILAIIELVMNQRYHRNRYKR